MGEIMRFRSARPAQRRVPDPATTLSLPNPFRIEPILQGAPYYFQSIEQEGRWKHQIWGFSEGRNLVPPELDMPPDAGEGGEVYSTNPAPDCYSRLNKWKASSDVETIAVGDSNGPLLFARRAVLLRVKIGALQQSQGALSSALQAAEVASPLVALLNGTVLAAGTFTIGATWLVSKTEILAGYAGLFSATGFGSVYGHRAKVEIGGVPVGNYIPTAHLIGMSGYINPVGPVYIEFRCAVVVVSGLDPPDVIPAYGSWWIRDRNSESEMKLDTNNTTWFIDLSDPTKPPR
jgi:hypothetical protein